MPGSIPPDFMSVLLNFVGMAVAGLIGATSRICDEVQTGKRKKFWTKELFVDLTSFTVMILIAAAISEYFELSRMGAAALAGVMCRAGTPLLDNVLKLLIKKLSTQNKW